MKSVLRMPVPLILALCAACGPVADQRSAEVDLRPPLVESVQSLSSEQIRIQFDEDACLTLEKTRIDPGLSIAGIVGQGKEVVIRGAPQSPGRLYTLEAEARDARGNSASFIAQFYGWNGNVPRLLINEFTPRGSGSHPDLVELKALTGGDMGGVALFLGTPGSFDARFIFPACPVPAGSYILVHLKPSGDPGEADETSDFTVSRGFDASDSAYDFWLPEGKGLGGNNGVLSLYDRLGGKCLDGVLYSNRTSQSDQSYRGFGSAAMLARAEELVRDAGWKPAGPRVLPEDAVNPEGSTGTRSICRSSDSMDSDGPADWHIVPTRKSTFGAANGDAELRPTEETPTADSRSLP
ncbi:MAG: hypothetical protein ABSF77_01950 [Spirochaetia bacterium]|jgi:hypothetical protein